MPNEYLSPFVWGSRSSMSWLQLTFLADLPEFSFMTFMPQKGHLIFSQIYFSLSNFKNFAHVPPSAWNAPSLSLVHNPIPSPIRLQVSLIWFPEQEREKVKVTPRKNNLPFWTEEGTTTEEGIIKCDCDCIIIERSRKHLVCRISTLWWLCT